MHTYQDRHGSTRCADCGRYIQQIGDVLPVHICPPDEARFFLVGDLVWIQRNNIVKPGIVIALRGGKHPYRVHYRQKTRPDQEVWAYPGDLKPRTEEETKAWGWVW